VHVGSENVTRRNPAAGRPATTVEPSVGRCAGDLASSVNALFAVGLDLAAIRRMVDDQAASRIDSAIEKIDAIILTMRSHALASVLEHDSAVADVPDRDGGDRPSDVIRCRTPRVAGGRLLPSGTRPDHASQVESGRV
jgi:hypothetical protein